MSKMNYRHIGKRFEISSEKDDKKQPLFHRGNPLVTGNKTSNNLSEFDLDALAKLEGEKRKKKRRDSRPLRRCWRCKYHVAQFGKRICDGCYEDEQKKLQ
jgi:hypothetical protein